MRTLSDSLFEALRGDCVSMSGFLAHRYSPEAAFPEAPMTAGVIPQTSKHRNSESYSTLWVLCIGQTVLQLPCTITMIELDGGKASQSEPDIHTSIQDSDHADVGLYSSMQNLIQGDAVYNALLPKQPEHAERRAMELVEKLQEEDASRQVAVLQSRIRKQELEGAQLRQEVAALQAKCRQTEESAAVSHAEGSAHAEKAKASDSEARVLRSELEAVSQKLSECQSEAAVCDTRNAMLTRQIADIKSAERTRMLEFTQKTQQLESTVAQMNKRIAALGSQLTEAVKERDELRACTHELRSTMSVQAKQLEQEMTKAVQERDEQAAERSMHSLR
jgi:hypothetical protein